MDSLQILLTKSRMARFVFCCLVASILVASHLANALPQEMVVGSACQLEAITADGLVDEKRVDECNRCWPRLALEDRASTEAAKECVRKFLPKLHSSCRREVLELTWGSPQQGANLLNCFISTVNQSNTATNRNGLLRRKRSGPISFGAGVGGLSFGAGAVIFASSIFLGPRGPLVLPLVDPQ